MGLFSSIGKALGISGDSAFMGGLGLFNGIMGAQSAADTNATSMQMYYGNQEFQREMRDTQYQAAVKDLNAAGLNPMIAAKTGGNMASGGSSIPSLTPPYSAGAQAALNSASVAKLRADVDAADSATKVNEATADKVKADTKLTLANAAQAEWQVRQNDYVEKYGNLLPTLVGEIDARSSEAMLRKWTANSDWNTLNQLNDLAREHGYNNFQTAVGHTEFRKLQQDYKLQSLEIPKAGALSDFYKSSFGHDIAPYLNSASSIESIGSGAIGTGINLFKRNPSQFLRK